MWPFANTERGALSVAKSFALAASTTHIPKVSPVTISAPPPLLRWAGSKRKLLGQLTPYWTREHERYVEPFMGSAALFFALQPARALLGDINAELVETLQLVRERAQDVFKILIDLPQGKANYYTLRNVAPGNLSEVARAARFIFLNRFCFNGLYRTNRSGQFNVPFGASKTGALPSWEHFSRVSAALATADIRCDDFESLVLTNVRRRDFVYMDPPYAVGNRRVFRQYGPTSFGLQDLERLAVLLKEIDRRGAAFLLSYAYCAEAIAAFGEWNKRKVFLQRNISGFAKHRRMAAELIVSNRPL
jgi:DNA adenine methylase